MPLFNFTAKQFWTTILLFTIILFFVLPVPILMMVSERSIIDADDLLRLKQDISEDWAESIRYIIVVLMSVFGVVVSCSRFKYLKNKVSIDFYHSLPVKRGQLFLTQLGVSALSLAIPYIFNILFTLIVIASNGLITETLIVNVLIMSADAFVYTTFFFALCTLVGMVSGLTAVQLTLTVVAVFIIPAVYITILAFINIFNENMWFTFYADPALFEKLSPALRFVFEAEPLHVFEAITLLLVSVLIFGAAYAIYMHRKSERAGTPVVFAPLGEVIKYVLVFLGTMLGGLLFYYIMDSFFWTVFGMICGMVLVFMLVNTILNKTARAMFKGWKGLCIFGAAAAVAFTMLMTNAFGINSNIPKPENTSRVVVNFDSAVSDMEFTDKEVIKALHTVYTDSDWTEFDGRYDSVMWYDYIYMEIVFYPDFGIPVAKTVRIYNKSDFAEEFRTILDSEEFKTQYVNAFNKLGNGDGYAYINIPEYAFDENNGVVDSYDSTHWNYDEFDLSYINARQMGLDLLAEANKACGYDFFQQPSFGDFYAYAYDDYYAETINLALMNSMTELIDHYIENGMMERTPDEYIEKLASCIDAIKVYKITNDNIEDDECLIVSDKAEIREILSSAVSPTGNRHSTYTFVETEYYAEYSIDIIERYEFTAYYDEDGNEYIEESSMDEENIRTYTETFELAFLLGQIPNFITEQLG